MLDQLDDGGERALGADVAAAVVHLADAVVLDRHVVLTRVEVAYR